MLRTLLSLVLILLLIPFVSIPLFAQGSPNITLLAHLDDYGSYNDCWGYTAPDGREYALLGVANGTSIVDITDAPANVQEIDFIPSANSTWKDIKTYRHYAYAVNESGGGLQIIDLSDLPNSATLAGTYNGFTTSHNIYIDTTEALLFAEGTSSIPVRIISLADPEAPVEIATFGIECHDVYAQDGLAYVAEGFQGSIGVYDYTNPSSPQFVERINIPSSGYVHNVWTTADANYLMSTEETTGKTVKMWNIQDLSNSDIEDTYIGPSGLAHNVLIKGEFAYIAHYADGLKILDISDKANIVEVGYYDTHNGTSGFVGAWGTFPYFNSGKVIASDISNGLFVFDFDDGTGTGGIQCSDIFFFNAKCNASGAAQAMVKMSGDWTGETVTFDLDGDDYVATVMSNGTNSIAKMTVPHAGMGMHTVTLESPAGCYSPVEINCQVDAPPDPEWDALWAEYEVLESQNRKALPEETRIVGNYPNPFNPTTTISYALNENVRVTLKVYNTLGQEVATLVDGFEQAGLQSVVWDVRTTAGQPAASGTYFIRLVAGNTVTTRKLMFLK